jgi:hypothetical protein
VSWRTPGSENVNAQVDELITSGVLRRVLAVTELQFSNSMIEAWWRSLKHQWLFLHSLDSVTTVRRLVEFYVDEHNRVLPHSAFRGQTPDEMYFGTGDAVPADLTSGAAAARRARAEANRSATCKACPSLDTSRMTTECLTARIVAESRGPLVSEGDSRAELGCAVARARVPNGSLGSEAADKQSWATTTRTRARKCRMFVETAPKRATVRLPLL